MRPAVALFVALLGTVPAQAGGLSGRMNDVFDSMSTTRAPALSLGQRRGVLAGGSYELRSHVVEVQPFAAEPPRISASCGGIDATFGSFSMISKDEATRLMRAVAANASAYAFKLALESLCPSCMKQIDVLDDWMRDWNIHALDSCQLATELVDGSPLKTAAEERMKHARPFFGYARDDNDAGNQGPGKPSPAAALAEEDPALAATLITGNVVWRTLRESDLEHRLEGGDVELLEDLMSLTGTVVICAAGRNDCRAGSDDKPGDLGRRAIAPTLDLRTLVVGSAGGQRDVVALRCGIRREADGCLDPQPTTLPAFRGLAERYRELLIGPVAGDGRDTARGLIARLNHNVGRPTAAEENFLAIQGSYAGALVSLAKTNAASATEFTEVFADQIAADVVQKLLEDELHALARATAVSRYPEQGQATLDLVAAALARLASDRQGLSAGAADRKAALQMYELYFNRGQPAPVPGPLRR